MYTHVIVYRRYLDRYDLWVDERLRVTDDSLLLNLRLLHGDPEVKEISVERLDV